jgi:hypothetical protein
MTAVNTSYLTYAATNLTKPQRLKSLLCRSAKLDAAAQHMRTLLAVAASDAAVVSVWDIQVRASCTACLRQVYELCPTCCCLGVIPGGFCR